MAKTKVTADEYDEAHDQFMALMKTELPARGLGRLNTRLRGDGLIARRMSKRWYNKYLEDGGKSGDWKSFLTWLLENLPKILAIILPLFLKSIAWLIALPLALFCSTASAQIVVNAENEPFAKIVAMCQVEVKEGAEPRYEWRGDDDCEIEPVDGGRSLHIWSPPGKHTLSCKATMFRTMTVLVPDPEAPDDPAKFKRQTMRFAESLELYDATFVVSGAPPPAPKPDPEPTPDNPAGPLGKLVSAEARLILAEFFRDLAQSVRDGDYQTTGHVRAAYRAAVAKAQGDGLIPAGVAVIDRPVSDRITRAVGLADIKLTDQSKAALALELDAIAGDF